MQVLALFLSDLARFEVGLEKRVGDRVDGHQPGSLIRLVLGVGAADHVQTAVDLGILNLMQEVVQLAEVLLVQLARRKVRRELEVTVVVLFRRDFDDRFGVFGLEHRIFRNLVVFELFMELRDRAVAVGLHERGGQVADHRRVTAALRDLRLADVVDDVQVVVRHLADQHVRPVVAGKRHLLPRGEFEAAVGAEVHHRVRLEAVAQVEVGRDIGVRRGHLDAVDELVLVAALAGKRLRHQDHVAELNPPDGHIAFGSPEGFAGKFAVPLRDGLVEVGGHALFDPRQIVGRRDGDGLHARHGPGRRGIAGVGAESGVARLDLIVQLLGGFRERAGGVAGLLQPPEHI